MPTTEYTLKITQEELQILDKALGDMPFRLVNNLVQRLNQQILAQTATITPPVEKSEVTAN